MGACRGEEGLETECTLPSTPARLAGAGWYTRGTARGHGLREGGTSLEEAHSQARGTAQTALSSEWFLKILTLASRESLSICQCHGEPEKLGIRWIRV